MKQFRLWVWALILGGLVWAGSPLKLDLSSYRVVVVQNDRGEKVETFEPAVDVAPGDLVEWRLQATNHSKEALRDVALVIPVPEAMAYVPQTARPLEMNGATVLPEFSYDGVHFSRPPLYKKKIVKENGIEREVQVEVPPEAYTHVRWVIPIMLAGQQITVTMRTTVR